MKFQVFRHGDRTHDKYPDESYPTDPYRNNSFYPIGFGGLTNQGKCRLYNFGTSLRERYDRFLGDVYFPADVKVISTDKSRTKMSLETVLVSLYPPKGEQVWKRGFDWQPIPINYAPKSEDPFFMYWTCPMYKAEFKCARQTPKYRQELSHFDGLMRSLTNYTGRHCRDTEFIYYLYHTLTAQSFLNLPLPAWTRPYFPNGPIIDAALLEYDFMSYNTRMKRLNGGMSLRKVLDDMSVVMDEGAREKPKVHLYSAHENNIAGILQTLNLWKRVIPEYTSAVIFELYQENVEHYIKVVYFKGIPAEYEVRRLPGCSEYCPLERFLRITRNVVPINVTEECFGESHETYKFSQPITRLRWEG
ncbi:venom acid phosphatase Acph-1-like [Copidosoma floridanum]|uniref:venom acid phosphatase Acph-1-like n=1 Tax=Copidosoma floridanum TaxID=29053 RepID=UPI0006C97301|nr:venom acid phosphatase Acph-1-like [Copidosoma floridanum]